MTIDQVLVTLGGLGLASFVAWFFWFSKREGVRVGAGAGGVQEAQVIVKGGYTPDVLVVKAGRPVRLVFKRLESAACSEMVVFAEFNKSAKLPEGERFPSRLSLRSQGNTSLPARWGCSGAGLSWSEVVVAG